MASDHLVHELSGHVTFCSALFVSVYWNHEAVWTALLQGSVYLGCSELCIT